MVKVLWSGLTGEVGEAALKVVTKVDGVEITGGVDRISKLAEKILSGKESRGYWVDQLQDGSSTLNSGAREQTDWYQYRWLLQGLKANNSPCDFDVLVDFTNAEAFEWVLDLAVQARKPLVIRKADLSKDQIERLEDATRLIPVFCDDTCCRAMEVYIDNAFTLIESVGGRLTLREELYPGMEMPSKMAQAFQRRVLQKTGKLVKICSVDTLTREKMLCGWEFEVRNVEGSGSLPQWEFSQSGLAWDVLEIAKVMAAKPKQVGKFYDLRQIWEELPEKNACSAV